MTPCRTAPPPAVPSLAVRVLRWLAPRVGYHPEWRWWRRAIGGRWVLVMHLGWPGAPELWWRDDRFPWGRVVAREDWT